MHTLRVTLTAETDGRPLDDSPYVRELAAPLMQTFSYTIAPDGALPFVPDASGMEQVTAVVFTVTGGCIFFLNGQTGEGTVLDPGAVVALVGMVDCAGLPLFSLVSGSDSNLRVRGVVLGS